MTMQRNLKAVAALAVGLLCYAQAQAHGLEPLKLYDDFKADLLDPQRWFGAEQARLIKGNKLHLMQRNWPLATSDFGATPFSYNQTFRNASSITAIKARVTVKDLEVSSCAGRAQQELVNADVRTQLPEWTAHQRHGRCDVR